MPEGGRIAICGDITKRRYKVAVFDFDGTVSWLRHGWPGIMCRLFSSYYLPPGGKNELLDEILSLNGKPTIHQMRTFHHRACAVGIDAPPPEVLLEQYHDKLYAAIAERKGLLTRGKASQDDFLVAGVRKLLEELHSQGIKLFVLSGTVQPQVRAEAELLGVAHLFEGRIHGSPENPAGFTKLAMFQRFIEEEKINAEELITFGDGPIEIYNVASLGGTAIGVASNEEQNGGAERDERKARQLREAGAVAIIPDYECTSELLEILFS